MTAEAEKATQWCFENEQWAQTGSTFKLEKLNGIKLSKELTDWDYLAGARQIFDENGYLPGRFAFSPVSGKQLPAPVLATWLPTNGDGNANRLAPQSSSASFTKLVTALQQHWHASSTTMQQCAVTVKAPASNGLLFFSCNPGGYQSALFAIERSGALWLWQRGSQQWLQLRAKKLPLGRQPFDHGASTVVALHGQIGSDLIFASEEGADFVRVDPVNLAYDVERARGQALAAPGQIDGVAMVPLHNGKSVEIAVRAKGKSWYSIPATGEIPTITGKLGAPITSSDGSSLTWIGERGYLTVSRIADSITAVWQPWPADQIARPLLGPPYRNGDGDWQLLQNLNSKVWTSRLLNNQLSTEHKLRRASTTTARSTFQLDVKVSRPWDDYDPDDHPDANTHIIHPFLEGERLSALLYLRAPNERQTVLNFYENRAMQPAQYCIGWPITPANIYLFETARPWNAQWFVHDSALWLWIDDSGKLLRWSVP
ncbi:hypothetical protein [Stenotrophomonas sp.]|uniref:hypothetical protein n=1 Tax=Stenotrophomonas sp. TaxID=69392 RepID=UPI0028AB96B7|nr:hypothetical protein [Stenotrophomonas sp.]